MTVTTTSKGFPMTTASGRSMQLIVDVSMLQLWGIINEYRKKTEGKSGKLTTTIGWATNFLYNQWFFESKKDLKLVARLSAAYDKTDKNGKAHFIHISIPSVNQHGQLLKEWERFADLAPIGRGVALGFNQRKLIWIVMSVVAQMLIERMPELANLPEFVHGDKRF